MGTVFDLLLIKILINPFVSHWALKMLYSHVTLLMLRVVDVVAKTTVQQSARMQVAEFPGDIQVYI